MSASNDDRQAFLAAMGDVRPHRAAARVSVRRAAPPPVARSAEADARAVMAELLADPVDIDALEYGETLSYRAQGVQESVLRRLRRGHYRVDGNLDLHGYNRHQARLAVIDFLAECHARRWRCVRVVHGKGNGSPNSGPVLKAHVDSWLRRRKDVVAFCSAPSHDGGTGAAYVLLRAPAGGNHPQKRRPE